MTPVDHNLLEAVEHLPQLVRFWNSQEIFGPLLSLDWCGPAERGRFSAV